MGFKIIWNDPNLAEEGHNIYRSTSPMDINNLPAPLVVLGPDISEYEDGDVVDGQTYYYRVSAFTDSGTVEKVSEEMVALAEQDLVIVSNPEFWFSMDNILNGVIVDDSGNGYDATIFGDIYGEASPFGSAIVLDKEGDELVIPGLPLLENPNFSLSLWIWWDGTINTGEIETNAGIWGHQSATQNNTALSFVGTGVNDFRVRLGLLDKTDFPTPPSQQWVLITFTYDGSTLRLYQGSTEVGSISGSCGSIFGADQVQLIGSSSSQGERNFGGKLGPIRAYFKTLTPSEVTAISDEIN